MAAPARYFPASFIHPTDTTGAAAPVHRFYSMKDFYDDDEERGPSKSQLKREMTELQKLGTKLTELSDKQLTQIPLEGELAIAINDYRRIKHREGRRRMLQFIGRLMREIDVAPLQKAYDNLFMQSQEITQRLHQAEQWRERLLKEDNQKALDDFLAAFPEADRQHLRQLIRSAQKEQSQNKPPAAARKLFRYIRELNEGEVSDGDGDDTAMGSGASPDA